MRSHVQSSGGAQALLHPPAATNQKWNRSSLEIQEEADKPQTRDPKLRNAMVNLAAIALQPRGPAGNGGNDHVTALDVQSSGDPLDEPIQS